MIFIGIESNPRGSSYADIMIFFICIIWMVTVFKESILQEENFTFPIDCNKLEINAEILQVSLSYPSRHIEGDKINVLLT